MLEDMHERRAELKREIAQAATAAEHARLLEQIAALDEALGDRKLPSDGPMITGDPLVDKWERELAEGRKPDLDEGLAA